MQVVAFNVLLHDFAGWMRIKTLNHDYDIIMTELFLPVFVSWYLKGIQDFASALMVGNQLFDNGAFNLVTNNDSNQPAS